MHKYPQKSELCEFKWAITHTKNVSMTLCKWQGCHQHRPACLGSPALESCPLTDKGLFLVSSHEFALPRCRQVTPPPPLVQATALCKPQAGVGTVLIWVLI